MFRKMIPILPLAFALACGDDEEKDSGSDSEAVESEDTASVE